MEIPTANHRAFFIWKNSQIVLVFLTGFEPRVIKTLKEVRSCSLNWFSLVVIDNQRSLSSVYALARDRFTFRLV